MPTARLRALPASTRRRAAANISRGRVRRGSAISPTPNSLSTECERRRELQSDGALLYQRTAIGIQLLKILRLRLPEEQRIAHPTRIESCADQILLFLLEGFRRIQRRADADEDRTGIGRQTPREMIAQYREIKTGAGDNSRHSGAAIGTRNCNAIGCGVDDAWTLQDRLVHLRRRNVLALPAESVADPIDEMKKAAVVDHHQVASPKPGVALGEHVTQDFLLGFDRIGVALEAAARVDSRADAPDGFSDLTAGAGDAEAFAIADRRSRLRIDANDRRGKPMRQKRRNAPDRARFALDIVEREISFGRRVKFQDLRNRKSRLKIFPDVAAQAVAARESKPMPPLEFGRGRLQQISAEFAYILEQGAVPANQVLPERAGGEFVGQHYRSARREHAA